MVDYDLIKSQMEALSEDVPDFIPVMANVSALLFSEMPEVKAVLNIDSPVTGRFTEADRDGLVKLVSAMESVMVW